MLSSILSVCRCDGPTRVLLRCSSASESGSRIIILLPDSDAELQRNNTRVGPSHLQTDKMLESIKDFQDWRSYKDALVIDNSKMSIEETADQIASVL